MPNAEIFAKALFSLHESETLRLKPCKAAVKTFIRQSSEQGMWSLNTHYRSLEAAKILEAANLKTASGYHGFCRNRENGLTHEHMVPGEVIYGLLIGHPSPSVNAFEEILRKTGFRAIITQQENKRLRPSTMPDEYYDVSSPMYFNHLARYLEAKPGIQLQLRPERGWFQK